MVKKSQRIWIIFVGLFIALLAAFAVPKTEEKEVHAEFTDCGNHNFVNGFCTNSGCGMYQNCSGSGIEGNPYLITNAGQLYWFACVVNGGNDLTNKCVNPPSQKANAWGTLTTNITINENVNSSSARLWTPIGLSSYQGTFDGANYTISGVKCSTTESSAAFFNYLTTATVKNLKLSNCYTYVNGQSWYSACCLASTVGNSSDTAKISNCHTSGTVEGYSNSGYDLHAGGMVGVLNANGIIENSSSSVTVNGTGVGGIYCGGLVAWSRGTIQNSYATGTVTASGSGYTTDAGGLVGKQESGTITNSYATGAVNDTCPSGGNPMHAGGFGGEMFGSSTECYATGNVTGNVTSSSNPSETRVGGFVGFTEAGTFSKCYAKGNVSDTGYGNLRTGGFIALVKNSCTISNCYAIGNVSSSLPSSIYDNHTINSGGFIGATWTPGSGTKSINNCYCIGQVKVDSSLPIYAGMFHGSGDLTTSRVYKSGNVIIKTGSGSLIENSTGSAQTNYFRTGRVAYYLNNSTDGGTNWYQSIDNGIGPDEYPVLDSSRGKVYTCYSCGGTSVSCYTNSSSGSYSSHNYVNGFCTRCGKYQQPTLSNGYYQINNAGKLYWFAAVVNNDLDRCDNAPAQRNVSACAKLTDDITINNSVSSESARTWKPIGTWASGESSARENAYKGTFDGNNKTITGVKVNLFGGTSYVQGGFFGRTDSATISNLTITNSSVRVVTTAASTETRVGGLVGIQIGTSTIENCTLSNSSVLGSGYGGTVAVGGLVGVQYNNGGSEKCTLNNCNSTSTSVRGESTGATGVYNGGLVGWQNSGENAVGKFDVIDCNTDGSVTSDGYGWIGGAGIVGFENGISLMSDCSSSCDISVYNRSSDKDSGKNTRAGGLSFFQNSQSGNANHTVINCNATGSVYAEADNLMTIGGAFGYIRNATVSNCYATGGVEVKYTGNRSAGAHVGGFAGEIYKKESNGGTITECYSQGNVTLNGTAETMAGGFAGFVFNNYAGTSSAHSVLKIEKCYAKGNVTNNTTAADSGESRNHSGGFSGDNWADCNYGDIVYENCFAWGNCSINGTNSSANNFGVAVGGFSGVMNTSTSSTYPGKVYAYSCYARGNLTVTGSCTWLNLGKFAGYVSTTSYSKGNRLCATVTSDTTQELPYVPVCTITTSQSRQTSNYDDGTEYDPIDFCKGKVTCRLNNTSGTTPVSGGTNWYQSIDNGIGPDEYPVLDSSRGIVYSSSPCGKSSPAYSNYNKGSATQHSFDSNGFCTSCGAYQPCTGSGTSGSPYLIGNAGQLYWFACVVNGDTLNCEDYYAYSSKNTSAWGTLTADITIPEGRLWKPIGGSGGSNYYRGTFDGDNHTISGVKINMIGSTLTSSCIGFFGYVYGESSEIKNVGIINSSINAQSFDRVGGLIGYMSWGTINNCYFTGDITCYNSIGVGGLTGGAARINNSYATGSVTVIRTTSTPTLIAGGLAAQATTTKNCYATNSVVVTNSGSQIVVVGGLVGHLTSETLSNCYAIGDITVSGGEDQYFGRLVGLNRGTITNSYSLSNSKINGVAGAAHKGGQDGDASDGTQKTTAEFAGGEVTCRLNNTSGIDPVSGGTTWYQSIDNNLSPHDNYPLFESSRGTVYAAYKCGRGDTMFYTNIYSDDPPWTPSSRNHSFDSNGFCTYCGSYQKPASGVGSSQDPYQIANAGQLYWFAAVVNNELDKCEDIPSRNTSAYATLKNNITINNDISSESARLWKPIGSNGSSNYYTGVFNGAGYTISGMKINSTTYAGFFGYIYTGASVKNVGIINSSVVSQSSCSGLLVAYNEGGTIRNSYVTGEVIVTYLYNIYAGGLVGYIYGGGSIYNSYANVLVTATGTSSNAVYAGGLIGYRNGGSIHNNYAIGDIIVSGNGTKKADRLVAYNYAGSTINYSYSLDSSKINDVPGGNSIGSDTFGGTKKTSEEFARGEVTCRLNNTSGIDPVSGGTTWYQSIDNNLSPHDSYPLLDSRRGIVYHNGCAPSSPDFSNTEGSITHHFDNGFCQYCDLYQPPADGSGTLEDPYQIANAGQLYWFAAVVNNELNKCYEAPPTRDVNICGELTDDITINNDISSENARLWEPIGGSGGSNYYRGTFDGAGYTISGMKVNITGATSYVYAGLFGYVYGSSVTIQNVGVINSSVTASGSSYVYAGGLVGCLYSGTTSNSYSTCSVNATSTGSSDICAGGLVGYQNYGIIKDCYATGAISVTRTGSGLIKAGGLVGCNDYGPISTSYATGTVSATGSGNIHAGGLVGYQYGSMATIRNSYATGNINATGTGSYAANAGGLEGYQSGGTTINTYATGNVSATSTGSGAAIAGGLAGYAYNSTISNTYASNTYAIGDVTVSASGTKYAGRLVGYQNSGTVSDSYYLSTSTVDGVETPTDISGSTAKTATEFNNFAVKDLLQTYVNTNTTVSNPLSSWVQAQNSPEFSWDNHDLSTNLSWGNMTFAYDPEEGTWALPEGDEGENVIVFTNESNGAKLRYNSVFDISSQLSGITGGIAHSSGDVTYQGATWPMVNSSDMTVSTNSRNTTLTISGTPSGENFDRTTPESPIEIGTITFTISG